MSEPMYVEADVAVIGGSLGGVAAALAVARRGRTVVISEPTTWLGGQLTSQAVPPDEHAWIEQFGCTASYRQLRDGIRRYYRTHYPLTAAARADRHLNPGAGQVSKLCFEPRVALAVIEGMLAPHRAAGRVRVLLDHKPLSAEVEGDRVTGVTLRGPGRDVVVTAQYVLDGSETGDLLPLVGAEYVTGAEAAAETGEPHAAEKPRPGNMQAFTVCFAVEHRHGEDHTIDPPHDYAFWRDYQPDFWPGRQLGWVSPHPQTLEPHPHTFTPNPDADPRTVVADMSKDGASSDLWLFRRIAARRHFVPGAYASDICLVNWPMVDYLEGNLVDVSADEAAGHLAAAKRQSLSMLYWMQTEAPRPDGSTGFPGLRLAPEVMGTADGLAMAPYIREPRRIRAEYTIVEQDLALAVRGNRGAVSYADSVGVGMYHIDLHPSTGGDNYIDVGSSPYEIPLGALIPQRLDNLLPAGKCIGTTHITNGCYRIPPTEWNVGEVAGLLAAFCLDQDVIPRGVRANADRFASFAELLDAEGIESRWPSIHGY